MLQNDEICIKYEFHFENGITKLFNIILNKDTLDLYPAKINDTPSWAELSFNKCSLCSLDASKNKNCPVALNLVPVHEEFRDYFSYEKVQVTVKTGERTYIKDTTIQDGLSSLFGIVMVNSGCPVLEYLKPLSRFHLPFATAEETIFRVSSMYLISQYFLERKGLIGCFNMKGLEKIYSEISWINRDFSQRLLNAASKDADINALVNLDCFASMGSFLIDDMLSKYEQYFTAYFRKL